MPELPEVETIVRGLDRSLRGRVIAAVDVRWPRTIERSPLPIESAIGQRVASVGRLGKFILIHFDSGWLLAIHLRMTGRLIVVGGGDAVAHERFALRFEDGARLAFGDARKFGRVRLFDGNAAQELGVGVDALA